MLSWSWRKKKKPAAASRRAAGQVIALPSMYLTAHAPQPSTDLTLGMDQFARAAMETYRSSYQPLPTASVNEFAAFFSRPNYTHLFNEVKRQAGYEPDASELYEAMMAGFSMVPPRQDEMDERREVFTKEVAQSYVREINAWVLDKVVADTVAANKLWDHYAKYMNGPVDWGEDEDMHFGVDTRTRLNASRYDMTYLMAP